MSAPIKTPLTHDDALEMARAICPVAAQRICPSHAAHVCSLCQDVVKALMAVDVASREQAWADRGGPEMLAALKEAVASWELADEDSDDEPEDGDPLAEWKAVIAKAEGR